MAGALDVRVADNGRMVLPKAARTALGLDGGGVIVLEIDGDGVRLSSVAKSVRQAQALYRAHVRSPLSSDDFLAARKAEARRDGDLAD